MSIESPIDVVPESHEKKTNNLLNQISKSFFDFDDKLWTLDRKQKYVEYNGIKYEDSSNQLYIPLDKNLSVCPEYKGRFKDEDSSYLCLLSKSKQESWKIELKIYKKWMDSNLKDKNLVVSSSIIINPMSKEKNYSIEVDTETISRDKGFPMIANISGYLKNYFFEEEAIRTEELHDEIVLRNLFQEESDEDPDDILEKLWEEGV